MAISLKQIGEYLTQLDYKFYEDIKAERIQLIFAEKSRNWDIVVWMRCTNNGEIFQVEFSPLNRENYVFSIPLDDKNLSLILETLITLNSGYVLGAWEFYKNKDNNIGFPSFKVKTALKDNELTLQQFRTICDLSYSIFIDGCKNIFYMLENGKPMPEKIEVKMDEEEKAAFDEFMKQRQKTKKDKENSSI